MEETADRPADPAYFGGYVGDNYAAAGRPAGLDPAAAGRVVAASFNASFIDPDRRAGCLAERATYG
jgi:adenosine deaminase